MDPVQYLPLNPFLRLLLLLLLLVVQLLSRRDALHIGPELVDRLHPLVRGVRVKDDTAACQC